MATRGSLIVKVAVGVLAVFCLDDSVDVKLLICTGVRE
jgi:hypothetical protein